ncbi:unnamed protein product [Adineta steineri]|uniref:Uncharacterized protein n=1 Tax=Adineta steineri TaxID=433720 RepID=A0A819UXR1_9BILA|nr:unnamed protein product [Adineta steineri]CAF4095874.1 unnamed protein product [Adineta steineri]
MQFVSVSIVVFFFLITKIVNGQTLYPTSSGYIGAVYTMSNGANMNQILIHCLNANGQLTMTNAINTNGTGVNTTAGDPLYSQGSLVVYSNYLFAVNPGSNSLSMFMINPSDATKLTLLSVKSTYGLFPISVTVNSMYACVLTGGTMTGIRCFTYNSSGLFLMSSFDRNLTSYISQSIPPNGPPQTMSEILFSADNLALIISVKGSSTTMPGYLLFYTLSTNMTILAPSPTQMTPTNSALPFSMTLVGMNGLLITDPGANGVLTLQYSSATGMINNSMLTSINTSLAGALCWSTYSPNIGNYYVIAAGTATIVELNINMNSMSNPVQIIQYYTISNNTGALEATVVSLSGKDYLYILGTTSHVINGYKLNSSGNAIANGAVLVQQGNTTTIPKLAGIASFVQTQSGTNSAMLHLSSTFSIIITMIIIFINYQ